MAASRFLSAEWVLMRVIAPMLASRWLPGWCDDLWAGLIRERRLRDIFSEPAAHAIGWGELIGRPRAFRRRAG